MLYISVEKRYKLTWESNTDLKRYLNPNIT